MLRNKRKTQNLPEGERILMKEREDLIDGRGEGGGGGKESQKNFSL